MSEVLLDFGKMPVFIGCTDPESNPSDDLYWKMKWGYKDDATFGIIDPPDPKIIYLQQHNELVGSTWKAHLAEFSSFVQENSSGKVLEVGGGNCALPIQVLSNTESTSITSWDIVEPNPLIDRNEFGKLIIGWFPESLNQESNYDSIIHSHVLEHVPNPLIFLKTCYEKLKLGGKIIFSLPNMRVMADNMDLNLLMFEHLTYLPEFEVCNLLETAGFGNIVVRNFGSHSIFFSAVKNSISNQNKQFKTAVPRSEVLEICQKYDHELSENVEELNRKIQSCDKPIWIFGAHIFTQYLVAKGLETQKINGILDNSSEKRDRRLYGTNFVVKSPKFLQDQDVLVISPMGNYELEIFLQLQTILKSGSEVIGLRSGSKRIEK